MSNIITTDLEHKEKSQDLHHSDLNKLAKNAGISGLGEIFFNFVGYVTSIVITRTVGPSVYGIFNIANIVIWIAQIFSSAGMSEGALRFIAFYKARRDMARVQGTILFCTKVAASLSLLLGILLFFIADVLAVSFFHNPDVGWAIKVMSLSLPLLTLGELWLKSIQSFQIVRYQILIQKIIQPVLKLIVVIVLFQAGMELAGIVIASIITFFAGFALSYRYLVKIFPFYKRDRPAIYEKKRIFVYSLPLSMTQFLGVVAFYIDSLMLGYFMSTVEVGVYTVIARLSLLVLLPLTAMNMIFAPMISELFSQRKNEKLESLFKTVTKWIFFLSLPVFFIFVLFAEQIMGIFGTGFIIGATSLIVLSIGELINASVGSVGYMLTMTGKSRIVLLNTVAFCSINIVLNYLLIPIYGLIGAAVATGISISIVNILRLIEVYYFMKVHPFKLSFLKPALAGIISFITVKAAVQYITSTSLYYAFFMISVYAGIYLLLNYLFKIDKEDEYIIKMVFRKIRRSAN